MRNKSDLPTKKYDKISLPYISIKKLEKVWEEVRYCSDRCRREKPSAKRSNPT